MSGGVAGGGGGDKVTVTAEWRQRRRSPRPYLPAHQVIPLLLIKRILRQVLIFPYRGAALLAKQPPPEDSGRRGHGLRNGSGIWHQKRKLLPRARLSLRLRIPCVRYDLCNKGRWGGGVDSGDLRIVGARCPGL